MDNAVSLAAMIIVASFGIERIATGTFFLLEFIPGVKGLTGDNAVGKAPVSRVGRLAFYGLVGAMAALVVSFYPELRVLTRLGITSHPHPLFDPAFTTIVLMGGSDRIAALSKPSSAGAKTTKPRPVEVVGTLRLEDDSRKDVRQV